MEIQKPDVGDGIGDERRNRQAAFPGLGVFLKRIERPDQISYDRDGNVQRGKVILQKLYEKGNLMLLERTS